MNARTGDWSRMHATLNNHAKRLGKAMHLALKQEAQLLRREIVQGITRQAPGGAAFKQLAKLTKATRSIRGFGGTKALVDRGDLRNSVTNVDRGSSIFTGILRNARRRDGKSLVNLAKMEEEGFGPVLIPITPKMRGFLAALYRIAGAPRARGRGNGMVVMAIPPRPWLAPAFRAYARGAAQRYRARVHSILERS